MSRTALHRSAVLSGLLLGGGALSACNPAQGVCRAEYDCQETIGLSLEDDYVEVCTVTRDAQQEILRANAEKVCSDLANAELALLACLNSPLLTCEERADFANNPSSTICEPARTARDEAFVAADQGLACDGIDDEPAASSSDESGVDAGAADVTDAGASPADEEVGDAGPA